MKEISFNDEDIQIKMREQLELISAVTASYNIVYVVSLQDDSFRQLRMDDFIFGKDERFDNFTQAKEFFIDKVLHPSDKETIRNELDYDTIREKTQKVKSYTVEYRAILDGVTVWHEMNISKIDDDIVAISFVVKDEEITLRHLQQKRYEDFFAFYVVDIDMGMIKAIKTPPRAKMLTAGMAGPYKEMMMSYADSLEGETKEIFTKFSDLHCVKQELAQEDKRTFSYKSHLYVDDKWVNLSSYVTARNRDGSPSEFTLCFSLADSVDTNARDIQQRINEDMQMIGGLASEYHALYYFNIEDSIFKVYSIDEKRFPEAKMFLQSPDPIETFKKFGHSPLVHPDDRHVFDDIDIGTILEKLAHTKKVRYRFRRKFGDEYFWTEMEFIKYEEINEKPNIIALGFAERDAEIRSEEALNRCFSILGKEISPEESISELMALAGEYYDANRAYIFEFTDGGKFIDNTFEWCKEGVEPMIEHLKGVPAEEVDGWMKEFRSHGAFYMDTLDVEGGYSTPEGRAMLEMQGIQSLIAAPIINGDEIVGFIGVDDPAKAQRSINILKNIATVAYSEILKRRQAQMAMFEYAKVFSDAFLSSYVSAYYINLKDFSQIVLHREGFIEETYGHIANYLESIEKYIAECVLPEDREKMLQAVQPEYIRERLAGESKFSVYMRDISGAELRWFRLDVTRGSDPDHAGLAFSDVTERLEEERQKRDQMRESMEIISGLAEEYMALFYVNMDEGTFKVYALDGSYMQDSSKFLSLNVKGPEILTAYGRSEYVHPEDRHLFDGLDDDMIRQRLAHSKKFSIRFRRHFEEKGYRWFELDFIKYGEVDDRPNAIAIGFADRDKEIRLEQERQRQLEAAYAAAEAANSSKTSFLFNMSHDIRTPMNAITGFTSMAKKNLEDTEKVTDYLDKIDLAGQQLLMLINQVLEMSRIESGKVELEEVPCDIKESYDALVTVLAEQAKGVGLEFHHHFSDIKHHKVFADKARMSQITLNITGNAIKYTPTGGCIDYSLKEVPCSREGYARYTFTVKDTGIGMSEEYQKVLFEPFSREKSSTVSKIQGTGLGLSIVKSLVDLLHGDIKVESAPGKGTKFDVSVELRLAEEDKPAAVQDDVAAGRDFIGRRVLLVEDNELNREIARFILEEEGLVVDEADDGDIAVAKIKSIVDAGDLNRYFAILMDVQMPRMNGYDATGEIRRILAPTGVHIPIIAMTANAFEEDRQNALGAGMDDHLAKPIDVTQLWTTLSKYL